MSEKLSKRELQSPDTFQSSISRAMEWAHDHPREVSFVGVGLIVVVVIAGVAGSRIGETSVPGGTDLSAALALVDRPVSEAAEGAASTGESFPSEKARQEAIAGALAKLRQDRPGSEVAVSAALPLASTELRMGRIDEALMLYGEYLANASAEAPLRFLAYEGKARALMEKGDLEAAAAAWDEMEKNAPGYGDRALFGRAELLEKQGKFAEARKAFEDVKGYKGGSVLASAAGERISNLERLHPSIRPPAEDEPAQVLPTTLTAPTGG